MDEPLDTLVSSLGFARFVPTWPNIVRIELFAAVFSLLIKETNRNSFQIWTLDASLDGKHLASDTCIENRTIGVFILAEN